MKIGLQEPDWGYIGAVLASSDDEAQTKFFKAFVKECLSWGTSYQAEFQLSGVNRKLTPEERDLLGMLSYNETDK